MTRWEKQMFEASFTPAEINKLVNTKSYYAGTCGGVDLYLKRGLMYKVKSIVRFSGQNLGIRKAKQYGINY